MANSRNPNSNSILQALIDLKDCGGYGDMSLDHIITKISGDRKLQKDLQAKWNAHAYPEKDMVYSQLSTTQALMRLSPSACKVLIFLGIYCAQSTLIKVSYPVLEVATEIKRTALREAVRELVDCGAIRVHTKPARHEAPIYSVDPALISKGVRRQSKQTEYMAALTGGGFPKGQYLSEAFSPVQVVKCDTIRSKDADGTPVYYNAVSLISADEAKKIPEPAGTDSGERVSKKRKSAKPKSTTGAEEPQIPGQMAVEDFPEYMPDPPLEGYDDSLPPGFFALDGGVS